MATTLALLFHRGSEGLVDRACTAAARALARRLLALEGLRVAVATPNPADWEDLPVEVFPDPPKAWRFGKRLAEIVGRFRPARLLYFSAGSGVLLEARELGTLAELAPGPEPFAVLNNFYSTDFALIAPPAPKPFVSLPRDNQLGMELFRSGYACYELPRGAATLLDLDTPGELQLLALHPSPPEDLRPILEGLPRERARKVVEIIGQVGTELFVLGRVSGDVAQLLDREAACRVRVLSEERGMEALGRAGRGLVKTLFSSLGRRPAEIVAALEGLASGVVWDTRPYLASQGLWPLPRDRFACDLLQPEETTTPLLRELAEACLSSPRPFLLGGQSLVSGGMYLACQLAWEGDRELPRRWRPLPITG